MTKAYTTIVFEHPPLSSVEADDFKKYILDDAKAMLFADDDQPYRVVEISEGHHGVTSK